MKKLLVVFGTRPEAIKLAPFILQARKQNEFKLIVCSTGQHREMLQPILRFFEIEPDYDLALMKPGQSLAEISAGVLTGVAQILQKEDVSAIVVQGDTTSSFIAGLAAFFQKIPVLHIEAGLRSGDIYSPFPEEFNRKATSILTHFHFVPTEDARKNLLLEHVGEKNIFVTGNTGIDALFTTLEKIKTNIHYAEQFKKDFSFLDSNKNLILSTIHRRESFGHPIEEIYKGLLELSKRTDLQILIPLHLNPQVRSSAEKVFGSKALWANQDHKKDVNIWLCEPVDYISFVQLMNQAHLIITDSGGIQEEAPSLGKPILVAREKTERPEAIAAGTSKLIPLETRAFVQAAYEILDDPIIYKQMAMAKNPFGDGTACNKILDIISKRFLSREQ